MRTGELTRLPVCACRSSGGNAALQATESHARRKSNAKSGAAPTPYLVLMTNQGLLSGDQRTRAYGPSSLFSWGLLLVTHRFSPDPKEVPSMGLPGRFFEKTQKSPKVSE